MVEWFRPGETRPGGARAGRPEDAGRDRTAHRHLLGRLLTPEGEAWYAWLLPRLAQEVNVLPCFVYTPPRWGVVPKTSSPPRDLKWYADFLDVMITRFGDTSSGSSCGTSRTTCASGTWRWTRNG